MAIQNPFDTGGKSTQQTGLIANAQSSGSPSNLSASLSRVDPKEDLVNKFNAGTLDLNSADAQTLRDMLEGRTPQAAQQPMYGGDAQTIDGVRPQGKPTGKSPQYDLPKPILVQADEFGNPTTGKGVGQSSGVTYTGDRYINPVIGRAPDSAAGTPFGEDGIVGGVKPTGGLGDTSGRDRRLPDIYPIGRLPDGTIGHLPSPTGSSKSPNQFNPNGYPILVQKDPPPQPAPPVPYYPAPSPTPTPVANTIQVDQKSTVRSQLNDLIAEDSNYIKAARAGAMRQANSRGLINSSMAAGAGELAAIQSALPIAQADAGTYFTAQRSNQDAENQFGLTNLNFQNNRTLQSDEFRFRGDQAALDRTQQSTLLDREIGASQTRLETELGNRTELQRMDNQLRESLLNTQIRADQDLTSLRAGLERESAAFLAQLNDERQLLDITRGRNVSNQLTQLNAANGLLNQINQVIASTEIPGEAKQGIIDAMQAQFRQFMDLAQSLEGVAVLEEGAGGI